MDLRAVPPLLPAGIALFAWGLLTAPFMATGGNPAVAALFILALALPSFHALARWQGLRRAAGILFLLGILAFAMEAIGVATGIPYGPFRYGTATGYLLLGLVPWTVPFAYLPILLGCYAVAARVGRSPAMVTGISAALLVLSDAVIEPAITALGFWEWSGTGAYYGVPLSNFAGWLLTGALYTALLFLLTRGKEGTGAPPSALAGSLLLILPLWSGISAGLGLLIPAVLGVALTGAICCATRIPGK